MWGRLATCGGLSTRYPSAITNRAQVNNLPHMPLRGPMSGICRDLKLAWRNLRTRPLFSLMVIGMLALGIGGNAAIFSIFNSLFVRPLPFAESERLVGLDETA